MQIDISMATRASVAPIPAKNMPKLPRRVTMAGVDAIRESGPAVTAAIKR